MSLASNTRRNLGRGLSIIALMSLAACGTSGRGSFLAGTTGAGGAESASTGDGTTQVATNDHGAEMITGGGGGGGGGGPTGPGNPGDPGNPSNPVNPPTTPQNATTVTTGGGLVTDLLGGVLHTAGNAVLVTPDLLQPVGALPVVGPTAAAVLQPVGNLLNTVSGTLENGGLADVPVVGSAVSQVASLGDTALNGAGLNKAVSLTAGGAQLSGLADGPSAVGLSLVNPTQSAGSALTAGVLANNQALTLGLGAPTSGAVTTASNGPANALLGVQAGSSALIPGGGSNPLVALNVGAATPTQGALITAGAASTGQPVSLAVGSGGLGNVAAGIPAALHGGLTGGELTNAAQGAVGAVGNTVNTVVTGLSAAAPSASAILPVIPTPAAPAAPALPTTQLAQTVTSAVGGVTGLLGGLGNLGR